MTMAVRRPCQLGTVELGRRCPKAPINLHTLLVYPHTLLSALIHSFLNTPRFRAALMSEFMLLNRVETRPYFKTLAGWQDPKKRINLRLNSCRGSYQRRAPSAGSPFSHSLLKHSLNHRPKDGISPESGSRVGPGRFFRCFTAEEHDGSSVIIESMLTTSSYTLTSHYKHSLPHRLLSKAIKR